MKQENKEQSTTADTADHGIYQRLFNYFSQEHNLTLLQCELDEIIDKVNECKAADVQPDTTVTEIANRIRTESDKYKNSEGIDWAEMVARKIVAANPPLRQEKSVREIAKREFDKLSFADGITSMVNPFENKAVARSWWNQAYDSAARNLPVDNGWTDDSLWDAYHKGYSDGHSDGVLYDMDREDRPVTQSYTDWLAEYKLAHSQITPKEESRMSAEEIRKLAEKKYGTDLYSFGQQRDGYVFGYQECLAIYKQSQVDVEKVDIKTIFDEFDFWCHNEDWEYQDGNFWNKQDMEGDNPQTMYQLYQIFKSK